MPCGVLQSVEKCLILEFDSEQKNRPVTSSETRSWQIVREQEIAPVHVGLLICTTVTVLYEGPYNTVTVVQITQNSLHVEHVLSVLLCDIAY